MHEVAFYIEATVNQFKSWYGADLSYRVARAMALKDTNVEKHSVSKICKSTYMGEPLVLQIINFCFEFMQDFKSSSAQYNNFLSYILETLKIFENYFNIGKGETIICWSLFFGLQCLPRSTGRLPKAEEGPSHGPRSV